MGMNVQELYDEQLWNEIEIHGDSNIASAVTHAMDNKYNAAEAEKARQFTSAQNQQAQEWNVQNAAQQQRYNLTNLAAQARYNMESQHDAQAFSKQMQDEQNEYNSIGAQIQRAKDAGVNPNSALGNSTASGSGTSPSGSSVGLPSSTLLSAPTGSSPQASSSSAPSFTDTSQRVANIVGAVADLGKTVKDGIMGYYEAKNLASGATKNLAEVDNLQAKTDYQKLVNNATPELLATEITKNIESAKKDKSDTYKNYIIGQKFVSDAKNDLMSGFHQYVQTVGGYEINKATLMHQFGATYSHLESHASEVVATLGLSSATSAYNLGESINKKVDESLKNVSSDKRRTFVEELNSLSANGKLGTSAGFDAVINVNAELAVGAAESDKTGESSELGSEFTNSTSSSSESFGAKLLNSNYYKESLKYVTALQVMQKYLHTNASLSRQAAEYIKNLKSKDHLYIDYIETRANASKITDEEIQSGLY